MNREGASPTPRVTLGRAVLGERARGPVRSPSSSPGRPGSQRPESAARLPRMSFTTYRIDRGGVDRLLFLMHGYTAEQHHLASYVPLVDPDERFTLSLIHI